MEATNIQFILLIHVCSEKRKGRRSGLSRPKVADISIILFYVDKKRNCNDYWRIRVWTTLTQTKKGKLPKVPPTDTLNNEKKQEQYYHNHQQL